MAQVIQQKLEQEDLNLIENYTLKMQTNNSQPALAPQGDNQTTGNEPEGGQLSSGMLRQKDDRKLEEVKKVKGGKEGCLIF